MISGTEIVPHKKESEMFYMIRKRPVTSIFVGLLIFILIGVVWQWLNKPRPVVDCSIRQPNFLADSCSVSIGSILYPAEYSLMIFSKEDRVEYIRTRDGSYRIGAGKLQIDNSWIKKYTPRGPEYPNELPPKVHRFYSLARAAAESCLEAKNKCATQ